MKAGKVLLLFLIVLFGCGLLWGDTQNTSGADPKNAYEIKLQELNTLEQKGIRNADLYNNIGICHFHTGKKGIAMLYFLRALNLNSAHKEARENLDYIIDISPDKALYPQHAYLVQLFFRFYNYMNINRLSIVVLILFALFVLSLHWLMHYDESREKALPILIMLIAFFILGSFSAMLITKYQRMRYNPKAVVSATETDGYDGSGEQYNRLFTIREATIVQIEESDGKWSLVSLPNGISGWVKSNDLTRVLN